MGKQTNKIDSFANWRTGIHQKLTQNNLKIRSFVWIQINYISNHDTNFCDVVSIVFEKKDKANVGEKLISQIQEKFSLFNIPSHYLDFNILSSKEIANILNLKLSSEPERDKYDSYWDYRLDTKPKNCLTCDIDAFEVGQNNFILIEAAQLFNTNKNEQLTEVIKHIFRTFIKRANKVNAFQYMVQDVIAQRLDAKSYIVFHKINDNILDELSPALLLENNFDFHNMLFAIADSNNYTVNDENKFIKNYSSYFNENIIQYDNIQQLYQSLGIIYNS